MSTTNKNGCDFIRNLFEVATKDNRTALFDSFLYAMLKRGRSKSMWILAKLSSLGFQVQVGNGPIVPLLDPRCNSGIGLRAMKFVSTNLIKHYHLIIQVDHCIFLHPIYSLQKTFRHPKHFFWVWPFNVDHTEECRSRTTSEQHPADSFSVGSQRPTPAGQQQCLEPAFLHGFARTCHTNHDTWAWGCKSSQTLTKIIQIIISDIERLVCKSDFNKDNKVCSQTFSVHNFCCNPPFSHPSLKVLPRGASYMPGNVELKRVELHRRLMNSQDLTSPQRLGLENPPELGGYFLNMKIRYKSRGLHFWIWGNLYYYVGITIV